jgi:hypothetical protein
MHLIPEFFQVLQSSFFPTRQMSLDSATRVAWALELRPLNPMPAVFLNSVHHRFTKAATISGAL